MEYKENSSSTYTTCSATETTGLSPGTYDVRYAAKTGYNAGSVTQVTITEYVSPEGNYYSFDESVFADNGVNLGSTNTGVLHVEFDATPAGNNIDGSIDYADTSTSVTDFDDLAIQVRFNGGGYFDVRNGAAFTYDGTAVTYSRNTEYHIEIVANMAAGTYSVYVTANGGTRTKIADNYSFEVPPRQQRPRPAICYSRRSGRRISADKS